MSSKSVLEIEIIRLEEEIEKHNFLYYNKNAPNITDEEYDRLKLELKHKKGQLRELGGIVNEDAVGASPDKKFKKIRHKQLMLSLENAFEDNDVQNFFNRIKKYLNDTVELVCEPKIDGLSFSAIYNRGELQYAVTRGNGIYGEEITENFKVVNRIPLKVNYDKEFEVRGEVYMNKSDFIKLNSFRQESGKSLFANPRNAAAGSLRQLDSAITASRNLKYFIWGGFVDGIRAQYNLLTFLGKLGFIINSNIELVCDLESLLKYHKSMHSLRYQLDYDIDGVVYKLNSIDMQNSLGSTSQFPKWAIAHKFPSQVGITKINDITIQVSRSGVLTPVAELEPINIGGVIVSRATLHNAQEITKNDFRIGDTVSVKRSGDVIPKIVSVEQHAESSIPYAFPEYCPVCGSEVKSFNEEAAKYCTGGIKCKQQAIGIIDHFASQEAFNIIGLGENQIQQMYELGIISTPFDLISLNKDKLSTLYKESGWGEKSINNMINAINKAKIIELSRFIYALGIKYVGIETAKAIGNHFVDINDIIECANSNDAVSKFIEIAGIGIKSATEIVKYLQNNKAMIIKLVQNITIKQEYVANNLELSNKLILFTGELNNYSRSEAKKLVESVGGKVTNNISQKVDYVIVGNNPGSKLQQAKRLGLKIVDEDWLMKASII